jgi:7-cyano-7-deazaguanine synthase
MHMTKAEEWALSEKLGILELVKSGTLTCYNGIPGDGCGECPACKLRLNGYRQYLKDRKAAK